MNKSTIQEMSDIQDAIYIVDCDTDLHMESIHSGRQLLEQTAALN